MKRTRSSEAAPKSHPTGGRYLYFVTASDEGLTITSRLDKDSTQKGEEIEAFFDRLVDRKVEAIPEDWDDDQYELFKTVMLYVEEKRNVDPANKKDLARLANLRKDLEKHPGLNFPFDWSGDDWGKWDGAEAHDWTTTFGKHYWYVSWW